MSLTFEDEQLLAGLRENERALRGRGLHGLADKVVLIAQDASAEMVRAARRAP
ncbi:MAG: hypothetical protein ACYDCK_01370 [Thermoplasmatota archaeon]